LCGLELEDIGGGNLLVQLRKLLLIALLIAASALVFGSAISGIDAITLGLLFTVTGVDFTIGVLRPKRSLLSSPESGSKTSPEELVPNRGADITARRYYGAIMTGSVAVVLGVLAYSVPWTLSLCLIPYLALQLINGVYAKFRGEAIVAVAFSATAIFFVTKQETERIQIDLDRIEKMEYRRGRLRVVLKTRVVFNALLARSVAELVVSTWKKPDEASTGADEGEE